MLIALRDRLSAAEEPPSDEPRLVDPSASGPLVVVGFDPFELRCMSEGRPVDLRLARVVPGAPEVPLGFVWADAVEAAVQRRGCVLLFLDEGSVEALDQGEHVSFPLSRLLTLPPLPENLAALKLGLDCTSVTLVLLRIDEPRDWTAAAARLGLVGPETPSRDLARAAGPARGRALFQALGRLFWRGMALLADPPPPAPPAPEEDDGRALREAAALDRAGKRPRAVRLYRTVHPLANARAAERYLDRVAREEGPSAAP